MCYSAQIRADLRRYQREWGASVDIHRFVELFWWKWEPGEVQRRGRPRIPKAVEQAFTQQQDTLEEQTIARYITEANARQAMEWQQQMFEQRARLVRAEQQLAVKVTKKATENVRIASAKIERFKTWLDDLQRPTLQPQDARMFPGWYAPVMVVQDGQRVALPMRYQCRPAGTPADYDRRFPGTYNARRDNLTGQFWRRLFGVSHGVMIVDRFYENVERPDGNVVLEFVPQDGREMLVACLWSRWVGEDGQELLSFAAITDEPPAEIAAAGHDRCIVSLKPEHLDRWLNPQGASLKELDEILGDPVRPVYEYQLAA